MDSTDLIAEFKSVHAQNLKAHEETKKFASSVTAELQEIGARVSELEQKSVRRVGAGSAETGQGLGEAITSHDSFKSWAANGYEGKSRFKFEGKTIATIGSGVSTGGGMVVPDLRTDPIALARRRLTIRDLLAPGSTNSNAVLMPRQTARQNNAAPAPELSAKPQSDFTMELVNWPVRTIAHFVQASRQIMDDAPALKSFIDAELEYGLKLAEETELLAGDGTGEQLLGLIPSATAYSAAFSISGETALDRVAMGLLQVELALYAADGVVLHPTDFTKMRLTKDAQARYILGPPGSPTPPVLWGVPLVVTPAITAGTFLTGAFGQAGQIFDRMGVEILLSTEHGTNFTTNQITIRAEERLAMSVKKPIALVTGNLP